MDPKSIDGQLEALRGAEIAAAGGHGLAIVGPNPQYRLRVACLYARLLQAAAGSDRSLPVRVPHWSAAAAAMVGTIAKIEQCELARANGGVLVLDEATRFDRGVLEAVATAVQDNVLIARDATTESRRPIRVHLVMAMAQCPCEECDEALGRERCTEEQQRRYLDRIPPRLWTAVGVVARTHQGQTTGPASPTLVASLEERVHAARRRALHRQGRANANLGVQDLAKEIATPADRTTPRAGPGGDHGTDEGREDHRGPRREGRNRTCAHHCRDGFRAVARQVATQSDRLQRAIVRTT